MPEIALFSIPFWIFAGWRLSYEKSGLIIVIALIGIFKYPISNNQEFALWPTDKWANPAAFLFALSIIAFVVVAISAFARFVFDLSKKKKQGRD